ncbi:predicted protein [Aspergillus nidulans FGSC A4]|uniref:Uncharacterized protein n=1 Tax=Emericella nidulans (strain FGSC A4 / ATCC 38163 / CBS 112.46 / NRRL 194 / M139) TaxID=227321 RepID=Q5B6P4_EMENI|nr:hypothetical protein [Aspergillus nidulans FGSC A4]EAA59994.1 predicted protein [Aspergillus nidulans FGSC A4]CBF75386.1 TPA: hypothetical protein ANIA_03786 [Aspergillus nidulans FGSC A4]|eukprot:XP_661390.1 predicted protein [Aspergillus nidulans FGSC A4]
MRAKRRQPGALPPITAPPPPQAASSPAQWLKSEYRLEMLGIGARVEAFVWSAWLGIGVPARRKLLDSRTTNYSPVLRGCDQHGAVKSVTNPASYRAQNYAYFSATETRSRGE